jgi:hypothetical protein
MLFLPLLGVDLRLYFVNQVWQYEFRGGLHSEFYSSVMDVYLLRGNYWLKR